MKATRMLWRALLVGGAALLVSCSDQSPTGLTAANPRADVVGSLLSGVGSLLSHTGLVGCSPMPYDSVTQTVGPLGGSIAIGQNTLTIPAGALSQQVTITAVTPSDTVNTIRFGPQGLQFQKPALLAMSYANCGLVNRLLPQHIAYTTEDLQILELIPGIDLLLSQRVQGPIQHFSRYAVAW
jgi:hypothetical protein